GNVRSVGHTGGGRGRRTTGHANQCRHGRNEVTQVLVVERPWTLVSWLILNETDLGCIREGLECVTQTVERNWVQHLNTDNGDIVAALGSALLLQVVVDLARAQHDGLDLVNITDDVAVTVDQVWIVDDRGKG